MVSSITDFNKTLRTQVVLIGLIFLASFSTFFLGWGMMRYSVTTVMPMEKFVYWRFAMAGWLPLVAILVTFFFVVQLMFSVTRRKIRGLALISGLHMVICFVALVWVLIFCAWEITTWTECNDPGPKHPECRNRDYPEETIADPSFIMMVISSAVNAGVMGWCLYFNSMAGIMRKAMVLTEQGVIADSIDVEDSAEVIGGIFGKKKKNKKNKKRHPYVKEQYAEPNSTDWINSQGV